MSTVSFASLLRCGAFSGDDPPEPFLEPSTDAAPVLVALLRLRRRRAERLVPLPVPAVAVPAAAPAAPALELPALDEPSPELPFPPPPAEPADELAELDEADEAELRWPPWRLLRSP
jgi:hypothetical protein